MALLCLALAGCGSNALKAYNTWIEGQNARKIRGCYDVSVTVAGGGGLGAGINGSINANGVVVTGGMTTKACAEYRNMLRDTGGTI